MNAAMLMKRFELEHFNSSLSTWNAFSWWNVLEMRIYLRNCYHVTLRYSPRWLNLELNVQTVSRIYSIHFSESVSTRITIPYSKAILSSFHHQSLNSMQWKLIKQSQHVKDYDKFTNPLIQGWNIDRAYHFQWIAINLSQYNNWTVLQGIWWFIGFFPLMILFYEL